MSSIYSEIVDPRDIVFTPAEIGSLGTSSIKQRKELKNSGIPLYLDSVDKTFLPALPGDLITVIGRPGSGKTGFMMRWARKRAEVLAENGIDDRLVVYVTYEQTIEDLHAFHVAAENGISITEMARGELTEAQLGQVELSGVKRASLPLWYVGHSMEHRRKRPLITVENLAMALRSIEEWHDSDQFKIDVVFVDYLQRIPLERGVESKTIGTSDALDRLKNGALAFGCPFVVGVQARRDVDKYKLPIPSMDDGQWTSNIEQSSDKIFSLVRPSKYMSDGDLFGSMVVNGHSQMLVSLLKQKLGEDNKAFWVYFDPAYNKLDELEVRYANLDPLD